MMLPQSGSSSCIPCYGLLQNSRIRAVNSLRIGAYVWHAPWRYAGVICIPGTAAGAVRRRGGNAGGKATEECLRSCPGAAAFCAGRGALRLAAVDVDVGAA